MPEIILHHYPSSPYAEKVRLVCGVKRLTWRSVIIPMIMPKPDLLPLTGGYRKTPVMQIGADIYCDTQLIVREIERRFPEPSLYRGTDAGVANALAFWSDRNLLSPAVGIGLAGGCEFPPEFFADRSKFAGREISLERITAAGPLLLDQLRPQLEWLDSMLADGRPFLLGEHPTLVDCAAYHPCWFIRQLKGAEAAPLPEFPRLQAWMSRVKSLGHGSPVEMDSKEALRIASDGRPQFERKTDAHDSFGRKLGDKVQVVPDDMGRDPVSGELVSISRDEIVIVRRDEQVGEVAVHFPRVGFLVKAG